MKQLLSLLLSFALILSMALPAAAFGPNDSAMDQALTARDMASAIGGNLLPGWQPLYGMQCSYNNYGGANCTVNLREQGQVDILFQTQNYPATYYAAAGTTTNYFPHSPLVQPAHTAGVFSTAAGYTWGQIFLGQEWPSMTSQLYFYAYENGGTGFALQQAQVTPVYTGATCSTPWGTTIPDGAHAIAYASSSVACGSSCQYQERICSNGILSGTNQYASCTTPSCATCSFADGGSLPSGLTGGYQSTTDCGLSPSSFYCDSGSWRAYNELNSIWIKPVYQYCTPSWHNLSGSGTDGQMCTDWLVYNQVLTGIGTIGSARRAVYDFGQAVNDCVYYRASDYSCSYQPDSFKSLGYAPVASCIDGHGFWYTQILR